LGRKWLTEIGISTAVTVWGEGIEDGWVEECSPVVVEGS
jgi:hypothetical protein